MQVIFRNILKAYSGQCDGLVYYYNSRLDQVICRKLVKPKPTPQNEALSTKSRNLSTIPLNPDYIEDLKHYAFLASRKGAFLNWRNVFMRMMFKMEKDLGIDLRTLNKDEIIANSLPCISVKTAVEAGLLQSVAGYDRLVREM